MRVLWDEGFVEGIVGSSAGLFKVIYGKISFQLSYFWFHLLRVRFTLMMCQGFLSQDELVQLVRDIEIRTLLAGHKRRIELLRLQPLPIKLGEPTVAPDLFRIRDASSAT